ncbi:peptidylprolyl isomerase [Candidatus Gottesmanbacteria bacterium]|nr:peptidylprolyl isomerase [Candidatus Gottesmanbacteria bacterium]
MSSGEPKHLKDFFLYIAVIIVLILVSLFLFSRDSKNIKETSKSTSQSQNQAKTYSSPPPLSIDTKKKYTAEVTTSKGSFEIQLFTDEVPQTVNNFVFLSRDGFYTNTIFHRIMKGFMIQGGDPEGNGTGGPGYTFPDEKINRDYTRGIVAMANHGPNTNGSQFFIMHQDYNLPKQYVIFGKVTNGMDVIDEISDTPVEENAQRELSKPQSPILIENVKIVEK